MENFAFATVEIRDPNPGEVLVRNVCISVDPYMRGRMNDAKSYVPPFQIGQPLEGGAVGRVISSQNERLPVASVITLKPAIRYQFKTGQRDWPKT